MKNSDVDQMFIGAIRTNTQPIHIELGGGRKWMDDCHAGQAALL